MREEAGEYRLGGLCRCHSVWVCPVCAPEIRSARAFDIGLAGASHLEKGGGMTFGTATVQHGRRDPLRSTYSGVAKAWHSMNRNRAVVAFRRAHDWWGFLRTVEITWGESNGWHPHVHWVEMWEVPLSDADRREYMALLFASWETRVVGLGMGRPVQPHALKVLPCRVGSEDAKRLGDYLFDMSPMSAAHELTSLTTKRAKRHGLTPFELLWRVHDTQGDSKWAHLWWEYEKATRGRRMLGTSKGLLARLELPEEDPDVSSGGRVVGYVSSEDWGRLRFFAGGVGGVQALIEEAAALGSIGIRQAVGVLLGGAVKPSQYVEVLGPGDDGGMF